MTVFNLGSINVDHVYTVPHLPLPGETIAADSYATGLGGKGANQSVAAALGGAATVHIGAIGQDGGWTVQRLQGFGVDTSHIATLNLPTAHAIITVDPQGENAIVLYAGANADQSEARIAAALAGAGPGDSLLLQNETTLQPFAAQLARDKGMRVIYSAAPFSVEAVRAVLPHVSLLVMNRVESEQLAAALGPVDVPETIVTHGADGAVWTVRGGETVTAPAFAVQPVDTTGAGDCFIGSVAAALDAGMDRAGALRYASAAAALQVTRPGAADAMPARADVMAFLADQ